MEIGELTFFAVMMVAYSIYCDSGDRGRLLYLL